MSKYFLVFVLIPLFSSDLFAQERYSIFSFDEINMETFTYATKDGESLKLDIYLPADDSDFERAVLIYVHGGGFSSGTRDSEKIKDFCRQMAGYGVSGNDPEDGRG